MDIQAGDLGISANHIFPNRLTCDDMWWFRTKNYPWMFVLGDLQSHPNPSAKMTAGANCAKFLIRPGWPMSKVARSYFIGRHEVLFTRRDTAFHHAPAGQCSHCMAAVKLWSWELQTAFRSKPVPNSPSALEQVLRNLVLLFTVALSYMAPGQEWLSRET